MEVVWMFSGSRQVDWLTKFNRRIANFADHDGIVNGAYGWRWFQHWGDQPVQVAKLLKKDPTTRQAVIAMWDPSYDLQPHHKDRPCNTHIYFRVINGMLDMTVCNRSNDLVWGMFGANVVHMTYLHEFIATASDLPLGRYRVFTNNLHFYTDRDLYPNGDAIWDNLVEGPISPRDSLSLVTADTYRHFGVQCADFMRGKFDDLSNYWLRWVAKPLHDAYLSRTFEGGMSHLQLCDDLGWRLACEEWIIRHRKSTLCETCE
jgi:thymidylate synthase